MLVMAKLFLNSTWTDESSTVDGSFCKANPMEMSFLLLKRFKVLYDAHWRCTNIQTKRIKEIRKQKWQHKRSSKIFLVKFTRAPHHLQQACCECVTDTNENEFSTLLSPSKFYSIFAFIWFISATKNNIWFALLFITM